MNDNTKKFFDRISVFILKALLFGIAAAAIIYWIGACAGNFMDVSGSPSPGLHWKP